MTVKPAGKGFQFIELLPMVHGYSQLFFLVPPQKLLLDPIPVN
jgi:hypothetical protein